MNVKSVKHNYIVKSLTVATSILIPLITYPYVSRTIGPAGIGKVNFANSVVYYFHVIAQLGIPTYGIKLCSRIRDDKEELSRTAQEIMIINIVTSLLAFLLLFVSVCFVQKFQVEKKLLYVCSLTILFSCIGVEWLYSALEQYDFLAICSIAARLVSAGLMMLLIKSEDDYVKYGLLMVINTAGSGILNFINLRRLISFKKTGKYDFKRHLKPVGIFFAMSIATTIYTQMDSVMIGFINGTTENGYYDAAVKIKSVLVGLITSLGSVMLPRVSYYLEKGEEDKFYEMSGKALDFVAVVSLAFTVFFMAYARQTIMFLSGEKFENAILPMTLIMPSLVFIGITGITGIQMMIPMGKEKFVLYSEIIGAAVNLVINALLIPRLGASGAALGTVIAELAVLIYQFAVLWYCLKHLLKKVSWWKILAGLVLAAAGSFWIDNIFAGAVAFFAIYALVLVLLKETMATEAFNVLLRSVKKVLGKTS